MKNVQLKDLVTLKYGKDRKIADKVQGKNPIIGTGGIIGYTGSFLYDKPSVLIGRKGSIEETYFIDYPFWTIDTLFYTEINEELVVPKWFYYKTKTINFKRYQEGTGVPSLTVATLNKIKISIPDIDIQKTIVDTLSPFDEAILNNKKQIKLLEEFSQLLFHKWFVDFNFPNEEGEPYKDSGGEMVKVDGKMIPKGWSINSLNKLVDKSTKSIIPQDSPEATFLYYSIPVYDKTHMHSLEKGSAIGSNKYVVDRSNLLVSKLNPWFKRVVYPYNVKEAICSTEYVVFNPKFEGILEYLYVLARTNQFTEYNTRAASGTSNSHKRVSPKHMLRYNIYINIDIIKKFNEMIKPLIEKIFVLYEEKQLLEETRDLLIKKLIK